jgi:SlyX protein
LANETDNQAATAARLTDLEVRYSYLQRTVAELDQVVIELRAEVDRLRREIGALQTDVKEGPREDPPNEKPPHY